jgi:hypothetical protein
MKFLLKWWFPLLLVAAVGYGGWRYMRKRAENKKVAGVAGGGSPVGGNA